MELASHYDSLATQSGSAIAIYNMKNTDTVPAI